MIYLNVYDFLMLHNKTWLYWLIMYTPWAEFKQKNRDQRNTNWTLMSQNEMIYLSI